MLPCHHVYSRWCLDVQPPPVCVGRSFDGAQVASMHVPHLSDDARVLTALMTEERHHWSYICNRNEEMATRKRTHRSSLQQRRHSLVPRPLFPQLRMDYITATRKEGLVKCLTKVVLRGTDFIRMQSTRDVTYGV